LEKIAIIEKVCCEVFSTNAQAIGFYRSLGFAEEGRCPKAYRLGESKYVDGVLMYKFTG
jgi:ribosomal protein S18 acetylase RimI-like enzyme